MSTVVSALRLGSCKQCWGKTLRGEMMNRVPTLAFRLLLTSFLFCLCSATRVPAQTPAPSPSPESAKPATQEGENPFAPEKAAPLPPGITGSDVNDPRAKLSPGFYDAGEAAMGLKHVLL